LRLDFSPPLPLVITYIWQQTVVGSSIPNLSTLAPTLPRPPARAIAPACPVRSTNRICRVGIARPYARLARRVLFCDAAAR